MHVSIAILGVIVILAVLLDAFETVVLPRRVRRAFRLTSWFYRNTWIPWTKIASALPSRIRENFLAYFGPLSLIFLLAIWAFSLIFGFTLLQYGLGEHVRLSEEKITFGVLLYHSGETFFTLGYGDITPTTALSRFLAVLEAGMGFAFLGVVVGYLPVIYSSFSTRETEIGLLDARAGSPPTAVELLSRLGCCPDQTVLDDIFSGWERWCSDLLASHISYPVLCFFRSQHGNQSWLAALTVMLDTTALVIAGVNNIRPEQAKLTFAMARHAAVDLSQLVNARYDGAAPPRLDAERFRQLQQKLAVAGLTFQNSTAAQEKIGKLRDFYEPYLDGLSRRLYLDVPPWMTDEQKKDNWRTGPWDKMIQTKHLGENSAPLFDEHF
ncbi:MAG TPA: potassium channel family protein [Terriglobales bacterium]|jgi:Ion channel|nr:potassium channel family protein [Terriglobales bacterium]